MSTVADHTDIEYVGVARAPREGSFNQVVTGSNSVPPTIERIGYANFNAMLGCSVDAM